MLLIKTTDAAHAETVRDRQLAGVNDIALVLETIVKRVEIELGIGRHVEGNNNRCLQIVGQQRGKSHLAHTGNQQIAIRPVTPAPSGDTAFGFELVERLIEGEQDMGRRREAPLAILLHRAPLLVEVKHQRWRIAPGLFQRTLARHAKPHTRGSFEALVAGSDHGVELDLGGI